MKNPSAALKPHSSKWLAARRSKAKALATGRAFKTKTFSGPSSSPTEPHGGFRVPVAWVQELAVYQVRTATTREAPALPFTNLISITIWRFLRSQSFGN